MMLTTPQLSNFEFKSLGSSLLKSLKFKGNSNKFEKIGIKATSPFSRIYILLIVNGKN